VKVRLFVLGIAARADCADGAALGDLRSVLDPDRAQVHEGQGVAVGGLHGDAPSSAGTGAGECDDASGGCTDRLASGRGEVDAAMLPPGEGVVSEHERS
jgi:hypothetical protein